VDKAVMDTADSRPLISSFNPSWLSAVCIKGKSKPFENLLPVKHYVHTPVFTRLDDLGVGADLRQFTANDDYPIPAVSDREGYHKDHHYDWWVSGLRDYLCVKRSLLAHGISLNVGDNIFELGCASGRVLRHFACQETGLTIWAADIQLRHVEWVRKFLPRNIRVFQNTILPQLPVECNSQKLVYAFSVFTHIDDFELAWLAELRRILVPGGIAYLTIHSERTWQNMNPDWPLWKGLMREKDNIPDYAVSAELFAGPMPAPKTTLCWTSGQTYNAQVFHSDEYIRSAWGRFLSIKEVIPAGYAYQDVIVLQKE
jgi:SAM-dependent methyltransferase